MKKSITIITLLACFGVFAQNNVVKKVNELVSQNIGFKPISVLSVSQEIPNGDVGKAVTKATYAKIKMESLGDLMANKYENIEVEIPYQGATIKVQLYKVNLFAEGFHVDTDEAKAISYKAGLYYRGIIKGDSNSLVSFNFFRDEMNGIISNDALNNLVIGKFAKTDNVSDYIIYRDSDLKTSSNFDCHTKDNPENNSESVAENARETQSNRCVTVYFEIDNALFTANGSNVTTTSNWMTSVFNNVQTLYNNDGITVSLKSIYIWTTPDPYTGTSSTDYLYQFNNVRPVFDGDVGQLVGIDSGGLGGVAITRDGLCSTNNFSYSDLDFSYSTVPVFSWTVQVITHELGHLLGSAHTHACRWNGNNTAIDGCGQSAGYQEGSCLQGPIPSAAVKGTIMSYCHLVSGVGISFNNGFGPQPAAFILSTVENATCLSTDCINTCVNTISSITATTISDVSATINWVESSGTTATQISVFPLSGTPGTWYTPTANAYVATGLIPNTYYKVMLRKNCASLGLEGIELSMIFATTGDFCSGITVTDSGGITGNYMNFENTIRTIVPYNSSAKAKLTFSSFNLETDYDYLYVYNGSDTTFPEVSGGGFTGTGIPAPIESTATDGSLTMRLYSDGGVVASGFVATVSCATLGSSDFESAIDFTYYPNPTNASVVIKSKTEMSEVFIYNPEGRLLSQQKINGLESTVDLAAFASGTYFFKLRFNEKTVNFKILKFN